MWMQVLRSTGIQVVGEQWPSDWGERLREVNEGGFWESSLRRGVHFQTNPDPETGLYLHPAETRDMALKVFLPGLARTDHAFLDRVLITVRDWRSYTASVLRLQALDRGQSPDAIATSAEPAIEWWVENYTGLRDAIRRRYPVHIVSYDAVVDRPDRVVPPILQWMGIDGRADEAVSAVEATRRHSNHLPDPPELDAEAIAVFDELYRRVHEDADLDAVFIERMNALHSRLSPLFLELKRRSELAKP